MSRPARKPPYFRLLATRWTLVAKAVKEGNAHRRSQRLHSDTILCKWSTACNTCKYLQYITILKPFNNIGSINLTPCPFFVGSTEFQAGDGFQTRICYLRYKQKRTQKNQPRVCTSRNPMCCTRFFTVSVHIFKKLWLLQTPQFFWGEMSTVNCQVTTARIQSDSSGNKLHISSAHKMEWATWSWVQNVWQTPSCFGHKITLIPVTSNYTFLKLT